MISLPEDLFYPTAAPTSIVLARAHESHAERSVFMARIANDGYQKLKGRRVPRQGEQLTVVRDSFAAFLQGGTIVSDLWTTTAGSELQSGAEWSPQNWSTQPPLDEPEVTAAQTAVVQALFQATAHYPTLAKCALSDFAERWRHLPSLPYGHEASLSEFFEIFNGRSTGEKNYIEGEVPYISSGDATNSIVSIVSAAEDEQFACGGITVTAFGQAALQPWAFAARGNGGSAVRVLIPRYATSVREMVWFAAQINVQRWRFFYARMAIKSRLAASEFRVQSPPAALPDTGACLAQRLLAFQEALDLAAHL